MAFSVDLDAGPAAPPSTPQRILDVSDTTVGPELGPGGWFVFDNATRQLSRLRFPPTTVETVATIVGSFHVEDLAFDDVGALWLLGGGSLHRVDWRSGQVLGDLTLSGECAGVWSMTFFQGSLLGANGDLCTIDPTTGETSRRWRFWGPNGGWLVNDLNSDGGRLVAVAEAYVIPGPPFPSPFLHTVDLAIGELTQVAQAPFASYTPGFDLQRLQAPAIPGAGPLGGLALGLGLAICGLWALRNAR